MHLHAVAMGGRFREPDRDIAYTWCTKLAAEMNFRRGPKFRLRNGRRAASDDPYDIEGTKMTAAGAIGCLPRCHVGCDKSNNSR